MDRLGRVWNAAAGYSSLSNLSLSALVSVLVCFSAAVDVLPPNEWLTANQIGFIELLVSP